MPQALNDLDAFSTALPLTVGSIIFG
jgi:hypothetical protein